METVWKPGDVDIPININVGIKQDSGEALSVFNANLALDIGR